MSDDATLHAGAPALRCLGLIGDPFAIVDDVDSAAVRLMTHAAALELLKAIDMSAGQERSTPVWVEKSDEVPAYYHIASLAEVLGALADNDDMNVLAAYVPLDLMSVGRMRAPLNAVAERIGNPSFGRTLAAWVSSTLRPLDPALPEAALLDEAAVARLVEKLETDGEATIARYFGEWVPEREHSEDLEQLMRVAGARQGRLDVEPDEDAGTDEQDESDPFAESFIHPGDEAAEVGEDAEEQEEPADLADEALVADGLPKTDELVDYVIAYTRAHLSPVVARGLQAYRAQGASAMTQELKVTKAPKKTIAALARLAATRYRKTVLFYDRFDNWNYMPDENKPAIIGSISELRFLMGSHGVVALLVAQDQAPELAEQFAGARRIDQTFETSDAVDQEPPAVDRDVVKAWVRSAALNPDTQPVSDEVIGALLKRAAGDVGVLAELGSAAVTDAALSGLDHIDPASLEADPAS